MLQKPRERLGRGYWSRFGRWPCSSGAGFRPRSSSLRSLVLPLGVSYRELEEMMGERGVDVDYSTLYGGFSATRRRSRSGSAGTRAVGRSWRVDKTYIRVCGRWKYLYRAIDKRGHPLDFLLSDRRNAKAARRFLAKASKTRNWTPGSSPPTSPALPRGDRRLKRKASCKTLSGFVLPRSYLRRRSLCICRLGHRRRDRDPYGCRCRP